MNVDGDRVGADVTNRLVDVHVFAVEPYATRVFNCRDDLLLRDRTEELSFGARPAP